MKPPTAYDRSRRRSLFFARSTDPRPTDARPPSPAPHWSSTARRPRGTSGAREAVRKLLYLRLRRKRSRAQLCLLPREFGLLLDDLENLVHVAARRASRRAHECSHGDSWRGSAIPRGVGARATGKVHEGRIPRHTRDGGAALQSRSGRPARAPLTTPSAPAKPSATLLSRGDSRLDDEAAYNHLVDDPMDLVGVED